MIKAKSEDEDYPVETSLISSSAGMALVIWQTEKSCFILTIAGKDEDARAQNDSSDIS